MQFDSLVHACMLSSLPCSNISAWHLDQSFGDIYKAIFAGKMERCVPVIIYTFQELTHISYSICQIILPVMLELSDNTKIDFTANLGDKDYLTHSLLVVSMFSSKVHGCLKQSILSIQFYA